ncbi:MAG: class I SAM-dependent methyltransferase [Acidimicrobiales bacterium]
MVNVPEDPGSDHTFPPGFFSRADDHDDAEFYSFPRLVHHLDDHARVAVSELYENLGVAGRVLDLMSSWVSHLSTKPDHLTVLGMNTHELDQNPMADRRIRHDLNADPILPFPDASFDEAICTVSVDYMTQPVQVFDEIRRTLTTGGTFVCTFSNRCFPTKAVMGWLASSDEDRCGIVADYFATSVGWDEPQVRVLVGPGSGTDPLFAVWAHAV